MVTKIWVKIGSGNGLLPDGTKPLPEPMLTDASVKASDIHIRAISQEMLQPSITKICVKITNLKFRPNLPGANEFIHQSVTAVCTHYKSCYEKFVADGNVFVTNWIPVNQYFHQFRLSTQIFQWKGFLGAVSI